MTKRGQTAPPRPDQEEQPAPDFYRQFVNQETGIQMLMAIQDQLSRLDERGKAMKSTVDGIKTHVEDLVSWKHKIWGIVMCIGALSGVLAFIGAKLAGPGTFGTSTPPPPVQQRDEQPASVQTPAVPNRSAPRKGT